MDTKSNSVEDDRSGLGPGAVCFCAVALLLAWCEQRSDIFVGQMSLKIVHDAPMGERFDLARDIVLRVGRAGTDIAQALSAPMGQTSKNDVSSQGPHAFVERTETEREVSLTIELNF